MEEDKDPFASFGGKAIKVDAPKSEDKDPFAAFGGAALEKKPLVPASNSGSKPSKIGGLADPNSLTGINQQSNAVPYAPLTAPAKEQQLSQDDAVRQSRKVEQDRISANLNKVLKNIDPKGREIMSKMASYNIEHPDMLTAPTKEEHEHQDFMQTVPGKVLGTVAYLGSKATKGSLQVLKGGAWLADNTIGAGSDKSLGEQLNKLDKYTDYGLTKGDVANAEDSKALRNIGGLVELLPVIATGSATSNAAVFALQGMGQTKEVIDDLKTKGQKIDPWVEKAFVVGGGAVSATLMGDLGRGIFSKIPANMRREIVSGITADAIKESAGKELTGTAFKELLDNGAKKLSDKIERFGVDALTHYKRTVIDLSKYNAANFALKKGVDVANSSGPVFNENLGTLAEGLKSVATEQAPFFALAGQISDIGKLTKYSSYKNDVVESLMSDHSAENIDRVKQSLYDHGFDQNKADQWTPEEMGATFKQVDNIATIASKLPRNIKPSKLVEAVDLINGRDELVKRQEAIKQAKEGLDASVRDIPTPEQDLVDNKVDQANDKLQEAVIGKKTKYEADEEKGTYTKTLPTGETVKISKSRYELEQIEREARRTARDEQVSKFQENFPDYAVDVMGDLPNHVGRTFDRIESDKPADIVQVNEASDWLYGKYKELQRMKDTDTRQLTVKQIDDTMAQLEADITTLENYKTKNHPDAEPSADKNTVVQNTEAHNEPINEPTNPNPAVERGQPEQVTPEVPKPTEPAEVNSTSPIDSSLAAKEVPQAEVAAENGVPVEDKAVQDFKNHKETSKTSFPDAVDRVLKEGGLNEIQIETLNKFKEILKDSNVFHGKDFKFGVENELLDGQDYGATIDFKNKDILIFKEDMFDYRTLVHEGAHLLSFKALNEYFPEFNQKYKNEIQKAFDKAKDEIGHNEDFAYAFSNLDEFVAEAFGNHDFQVQLSYIKSSGDSTNLFKSIINTIKTLVKDLYGINIESSVLEDIMVATENLPDSVKRTNKTKRVESAKNENINATAEANGIELEDTVGDTRSRKVVEKDAKQAIKDGLDPRDLVERILKDKHQATDTEVAVLAKHIDAVEGRLKELNTRLEKEGGTMTSADFNEATAERTRALSELQDAAQAARQTGTATARALGARRFEVNRDYSLANLISRKREALGGEKLTSDQLTELTKRHDALQEAQEAYENRIEQLEAENTRLRADRVVKAAERTKRKSVTKEQLAKERKEIFDEFSQKLKKMRTSGALNSVGKATADFLITAAPFVAKMVRNLAHEGVLEIKDVIAGVKENLDLHDLSDREIQDMIAGVYDEKKATRGELENQIATLKTEAKLLGQIEDAEKGMRKATGSSATKVNEKIKALRDKLKEIEKSNEPSQEEKDLASRKKYIAKQIEEVSRRIRESDFTKPEKNTAELDGEALEARRKYDKLKRDFDLEVEKDKLAKRSKAEKFKDNALNILSLPRALKATLDFSAPGRQGLLLSIGHPKAALTAMREMFGQTFSEERYTNWLADLKHSKLYDLMQSSDLYISDKNNVQILAREEEFTSNLAERIPVFGKAVAGAERAYTAYLNAIRTQVFTQQAERLLDQGYTFERNPEVFKGIAKVVNVLSGRGDIPLSAQATETLSLALFSPRFMASRIQTLYIWADPRLPKEARVLAAKDIGKTLAVAASIMVMATAAGATVERDPRSTDFLKLKFGNTRYDILAGVAPYVVFISQLLSGKKKTSSGGFQDFTGESKKRDAKDRGDLVLHFLRGKSSPLLGIGTNLLKKEDFLGNPYGLSNIPGEFVPLPLSDITGAYQMGGWQNALEVLIPAQFGIGVSSYDANAKKAAKKSIIIK